MTGLRSLLLLLLLLLASCSRPDISTYYLGCPYPQKEVRKAAKTIREIRYVDGFSDPMIVGAMDFDGIMYIDRNLPFHMRRRVTRHEECHWYEISVLGYGPRPIEKQHEGWL